MCDYEYPVAMVADNPGMYGRQWWEQERGEDADMPKNRTECPIESTKNTFLGDGSDGE